MLGQLIAGEGPHFGEILELVEFGDLLCLALHEDLIASTNGYVGEIGEAVLVFTMYADDADTEPRPETCVSDQLRNKRRVFGNPDFGVGDLGRDHGLEHWRLALDDKAAQSLQFCKLIESPLHENLITGAQYCLPAGQCLASSESDQRQNNQTSGRTDPTLGQRLADQDRIYRNPHHESPFLQLVVRAQVSLTAVFASLRLGFWQHQPADHRDEYDTCNQHCATHRCEIKQRKRLVAILCQCRADQKVRGRANQGRQAAE